MAKKFEYKVCASGDLRGNRMEVEEKLAKLGQEGWELAGTAAGRDGITSSYLFKREIESPITHKQEQNGYDMSR